MSSNDLEHSNNYQKVVEIKDDNGYEKTIQVISDDGYQVLIRLYGADAPKARNPFFLYPVYAEVCIQSDVCKEGKAWVITREEKRKNLFKLWRRTTHKSPHQQLADNILDAFSCIKDWHKKDLNQEGLVVLRNLFNDIYTDINTYQKKRENVDFSPKTNHTSAASLSKESVLITH